MVAARRWDGMGKMGRESARKVSSPAYVGKKQIKPEGDPDLSERLNMLTRLNGIDDGGIWSHSGCLGTLIGPSSGRRILSFHLRIGP